MMIALGDVYAGAFVTEYASLAAKTEEQRLTSVLLLLLVTSSGKTSRLQEKPNMTSSGGCRSATFTSSISTRLAPIFVTQVSLSF